MFLKQNKVIDNIGVISGLILLITQSIIIILDHRVSFDEAITLFHIRQVDTLGFSALLQDVHMVLYECLLAVWTKIFNPSMVTSKVLSLIFSIITLCVFYNFVKKYFSKLTAVLAALLLSCNPTFVVFSQETRSYSLLILLSLISFWRYFCLTKVQSKQFVLFYIISLTLLSYTHFVGFLIFICQFLHAFLWVKKKKFIFQVFTSQFVAVLFFIPILLIIFNRYNYLDDLPKIYSYIPTPGWIDFWRGFVFLSGSKIFAWVFLLFLAIAPWLFKKQRDDNIKSILVFGTIWLFIPIVFLLLYSIIHTPVFIARGFVFGILPLILLVSYSFEKIWTIHKHLKLTGYAFLASLIGLMIQKNVLGMNRQHYTFKQVSRKIENYRKDQNPSIFYFPDSFKYNIAYYLEPECFRQPTDEKLKTCLKERSIKPISFKEHPSLNMTGPDIVYIGYKTRRKSKIKKIENLFSQIGYTLNQNTRFTSGRLEAAVFSK